MKTKTFDCVRMKLDGARAIGEALRNLSREERLAYWKKAEKMMGIGKTP